MRVYVESVLPCSAENAWSAVQTSVLLCEVAFPVIVFRAVAGERFPERWSPGLTVQCRPYLFAIVPLPIRTLRFERVDDEQQAIQTREWDLLVRRWDHLIRVRPETEGICRYSDEIEIEAGWRTPIVALFAKLFYRHRQRRWRRVARRIAAELTPGAVAGR